MSLSDYLLDYEKNGAVGDFERSLDLALGELDVLKEADSQIAITTATWGIDYWEKIYGIIPDLTLGIQQRREIVISKMRTAATTTIDVVKEISSSFANGEVNVVEKNEIYTVEITFVAETGIPDNLEALKSALRAAVPAHIALEFKFTFITWGQWIGATWGDLTAKTWLEVKEGV